MFKKIANNGSSKISSQCSVQHRVVTTFILKHSVKHEYIYLTLRRGWTSFEEAGEGNNKNLLQTEGIYILTGYCTVFHGNCSCIRFGTSWRLLLDTLTTFKEFLLTLLHVLRLLLLFKVGKTGWGSFQPSTFFTVKINTKISQLEFKLKGTPLKYLFLFESQEAPLLLRLYLSLLLSTLCNSACEPTLSQDSMIKEAIQSFGSKNISDILFHLDHRIRLHLEALTLSCPCYVTQSWFLTPLPLYITLYLNIPIQVKRWPWQQTAVHNKQAQLNVSAEEGRLHPHTTYI